MFNFFRSITFQLLNNSAFSANSWPFILMVLCISGNTFSRFPKSLQLSAFTLFLQEMQMLASLFCLSNLFFSSAWLWCVSRPTSSSVSSCCWRKMARCSQSGSKTPAARTAARQASALCVWRSGATPSSETPPPSQRPRLFLFFPCLLTFCLWSFWVVLTLCWAWSISAAVKCFQVTLFWFLLDGCDVTAPNRCSSTCL